jgi:hypothetical protein
MELTKLDLVEEIAAESDLILRAWLRSTMCQCIPPAPKLSI